MIKKKYIALFSIFLIFKGNCSLSDMQKSRSMMQKQFIYENVPSVFLKNPTICNIFIEGIETIDIQVILAKLPVFIGERLERKKTAMIVRNIFSTTYLVM